MPIPAVAVRELVYDANGQVVKEPKTDKRSGTRRAGGVGAAELKPGQTRKETEGVFVVRDNKAEFVPIKMGIAGDKYFEVLSGLKAGDRSITGPYNSVRGMADGDPVKIDDDAQQTATKPRPHEQVLRIGEASRSTRSGRPSCGRS